MCVIAYKPQNQNFPERSVLMNCFINNPDGAGFMYAKDGVHIEKGFMNFDDFVRALNRVRMKYGDKIPYVLHFRISTQGGVRPDCTHPFPLSDKMDRLRELKTSCKIGIAHNGIISLTSSGFYKQITYSDTMEFITDYLSLIIKGRDYYKSADTMLLIERLAGSRLAILDGKGHCELIGHGWSKRDGVYFSNESYKPRVYTAPKQTTLQSVITSVYNDPYPGEDDIYWRGIELAKNTITGKYDLDPFDCPYFEHGDDSYCEKCSNYKNCYGVSANDEDADLYAGVYRSTDADPYDAEWDEKTGLCYYDPDNCPYVAYEDEGACEICANRHLCYGGNA